MGKTASRGARGRYTEEQSTDARTAENPGVGSQDRPTGTGESDPKKGYRSLDVGRVQSYALIDQAVAGAECNTVIELKLEHHAA